MPFKLPAFESWLRPAGATLIILLGLFLIVLTFLVREGRQFQGEARGSLKARLLFSSSFVENWFYDLRSKRFHDQGETSPNLVILEITDASLTRLGRWPWSRMRHASIVDNLKEYGAKVVMFDVLFPEPESPAADRAFAAAISRFTEDNSSTVYLGYGTSIYEEDAMPIPDPLYVSAVTGSPGSRGLVGKAFVDKNNFAAPDLQVFEAKFGFISASPDLDGVFRHKQLVNEIDGIFFPSLSLGGYLDFFSDGKERRITVESLGESAEYRLRIISPEGERQALLNSRGELKVRFFGGPRSFVRVPIEEVAEDPAPAANEKLRGILGGKAVLIGSSAFGAHDLRHTPLDPQTPGMYVHANVFHALDRNLFFRTEDENLLLSLGLYLLAVAGAVLLSLLKNPLYETGGTAALAGAIYSSDYLYFAPEGFFIRLFFVFFGLLGLYAWFTVLNVFQEAKEKKKIRDTFTRYVAPEIVKEMLANPEKLKVGGEKREITMLFSDVRDFTTISERLSPAELATLLNIYMGRMTDILFETGGTLDKYIGDALVGFWGAPLELPDHAYQAVRGAKLMLEALPEINKEFERRKFPRINVGIGLNTGEVSVGNMGSDRIFQYTALGDNMNLASRLESLTKYYGVNLMISEFTHAKLGDKVREFCIRPLDLVQVKGKSKAVKIYEVIPNWSPWAKEDALLERYTDAYERKYLQGRFAEAVTAFDEILQSIPGDKNTEKLRESALELQKSPPPEGWDGITVFTTK
jgi:adenylate cyclase